ncbi:hypothetical protein A2U01_0053894, partial [Trifolium medium]|nr:hypothetical protein [Trifolium medium]
MMPRRRKASRQVERDQDRQRWSSRHGGRDRQLRVREFSRDGNKFQERPQVAGHSDFHARNNQA